MERRGRTEERKEIERVEMMERAERLKVMEGWWKGGR